MLQLSKAEIGDMGAQALAEALRENSSLTKLELDANSIGDAGAQALAETLRENSSLATLRLAGNSIGDAGAQALAEALGENSSLATLELGSNGIGAAGAQALAEAVEGDEQPAVEVPHDALLRLRRRAVDPKLLRRREPVVVLLEGGAQVVARPRGEARARAAALHLREEALDLLGLPGQRRGEWCVVSGEWMSGAW